MGGSGCGVGGGGCDDGDGKSRFLTGLSARFGMTSIFLPRPVRNDIPFSPARFGMMSLFSKHSLGEFQAVGLVEEVPGFAVGVVLVAFAAAFGVEGERGQAEDVREREDVPGVFGDDVGDEEIDFGEFVGDGASVDAAVGVDAVEAAQKLGGGFDLDADEARADRGRKQVPFGKLRAGSHRAFGPVRNDRGEAFGTVRNDRGEAFGPVRNDRWEVGGVVFWAIEDDVVAFAVAVGAGDTEAVAGGGEGEG